jgi:antitoxin component YwqK of YwqJK toxin-antitoxin module
MSEATESPQPAGKEPSERVEHNDAGVVVMRGPLVKGQLRGEVRFFDDEGKLKRTARYADDAVNGEAVDYLPNGKVALRAFFTAGTLDGLLRRFDAQGRPEIVGTYA